MTSDYTYIPEPYVEPDDNSDELFGQRRETLQESLDELQQEIELEYDWYYSS